MPGLMVTFSFMTKHNAMLGRILHCNAECCLDKCHYVECRYAPSAIVLCRCWTYLHYVECCSLWVFVMLVCRVIILPVIGLIVILSNAVILNVILLSVLTLCVAFLYCHAERRFAKCHFADCRYVECLNAQVWSWTDCRSAECRLLSVVAPTPSVRCRC